MCKVKVNPFLCKTVSNNLTGQLPCESLNGKVQF